MKQLILEGFYTWSVFNQDKQMDFNGHLWVRPEGNVLVDPVALSPEDFTQLEELGGAAWCVLTNSDHLRATAELKERLGFRVICHEAEAPTLGIAADRVVKSGEELFDGMLAVHIAEGKTPGEMALLLPRHGAILFGDIVRGSPMGALRLLPDQKLRNPALALQSLRRLLPLPVRHVLVGDGASVFSLGQRALLDALAHHHAMDVYRMNIDDIPWAPASRDPRYGHHIKEISRCIGAQALGYNVRRLPAGAKSGPMHYHLNQEEFFYVIAGRCHLERPTETIELRAGDFVAFPPGEQGTHTLSNQSDAPCEVLCVSNLPEHDRLELVGMVDFRRDLLSP